ncbi:MAG: SDR family NAD(P)-dependent oxidoreductase [Chloroflexota bacterium]
MIENWAPLLMRPEIQFAREVVESAVRGKRVLITGAGGSIGSALGQTVATFQPERLVLLDSHEASLFRLRQRLEEDAVSEVGAAYVLADLRDRPKVCQVFRRERIDLAFHLAAYKHVPLAEDNLDQVVSVNVLGTLNVVEAAAEFNASTVVFPSSDKAVTALSAYAATKRIVEHVLQSMARESDRPRVRTVRLVNVAGTQGSVIETFVRQALAHLPLSITDPRMDRYWMTMPEAIHLLLAASGRPRLEGLSMLDVGKPVNIAETARRVQALVNPGATPLPPRVTGIRPGERLHEALTYPSERLRETDLPGLLTIETPPSAVGLQTWLDEIRRFRERGYDWEPEELKAWLVRLAAGSLTAPTAATSPRGR